MTLLITHQLATVIFRLYLMTLLMRLAQFNRAKQTHSDGGYKQVLHMAVVLFIQSFYFYVSHVEANIAAGKFKIVKLSLV